MIRLTWVFSLVLILGLLAASTELFGLLYSNLIYLSLPITIIVSCLLLSISAMIKRTKLLLLNIAALVFQIFLIHPAISIGNGLDIQNSFKVVSFNASFVKLPRVYSEDYWSNNLSPESIEIQDYFDQVSADVICIQEFFDDSLNSQYSYLKHFIDKGYTYNFLRNPKHDNGVSRGIVTLSKHPIVKREKVFLSGNRYNGISCTDIVKNNDTLRIVNVHLESMELYLGNKEFFQKVKYVLHEWKRTTLERHNQIDKLNQFLKDSPYELIVVGDFNEAPFSYNLVGLYEGVKSIFVERHSGLGSTLNKAGIPARIDNQYYSAGIKPLRLKIRKDITGSDHYPLEGYYSLD